MKTCATLIFINNYWDENGIAHDMRSVYWADHDNNSVYSVFGKCHVWWACMRISVFVAMFVGDAIRLYAARIAMIKMICRAKCSLDTIFLFHHKTITVNQSGSQSLNNSRSVRTFHWYIPSLSWIFFFVRLQIKYIHALHAIPIKHCIHNVCQSIHCLFVQQSKR